MVEEPLFHIASRADWADAQREGVYRRSTHGRSLEAEGYIHLSFGWQVKGVADFLYREVDDLVLLRIDPHRLTSDVVVEAGTAGGVRFPHLYGPLDVSAVVEIVDFPRRPDGTFGDVE